MLSVCVLHPAFASERLTLSSGSVRVHFPEGYKALAERAADEVEKGKARVSEVLGFDYTSLMDVYLARNAYEFNNLLSTIGTGRVHEWAAAVAIPSMSAIIIKIESLRAVGAGDVRQTIRHEIVHLFLRDYPVPLWLNEGLAEFASGRVLTDEEERFLLRTARGRGLFPLDAISSSFPRDAGDARLAYIQSCEFARFLYAELGSDAVRMVLQRMKVSGTAQDAFESVTGRPVGALFEQYASGLSKRHSFIRDVFTGLGLYGWMALLVIVVFIVTVIRNREKRRRLAADET